MEFAVPSVTPLAVPAFLAGMLVSWILVTWGLAVRRRGRRCPRCASPTLPVVLSRPFRFLGRKLTSRWCPECGWKGLAVRKPLHRIRIRRDVRFRGGFRWGKGIFR